MIASRNGIGIQENEKKNAKNSTSKSKRKYCYCCCCRCRYRLNRCKRKYSGCCCCFCGSYSRQIDDYLNGFVWFSSNFIVYIGNHINYSAFWKEKLNWNSQRAMYIHTSQIEHRAVYKVIKYVVNDFFSRFNSIHKTY